MVVAFEYLAARLAEAEEHKCKDARQDTGYPAKGACIDSTESHPLFNTKSRDSTCRIPARLLRYLLVGEVRLLLERRCASHANISFSYTVTANVLTRTIPPPIVTNDVRVSFRANTASSPIKNGSA